MRVSHKATYGILAALDLALQNGSAPVQAKAIARRQAIPVRFLEQVLHAMKKAGIVDSLRGAHGGYVLMKRPGEISLAEIVEALDGPLAPSRPRGSGTSGQRTRERSGPDSLLAQVWERVRQAELGVLEAVTLTELAERHQQLEQERAPMYHI
jgi:Rrf2 family protein